jgi:enamine deaminase RidA (YjgF/YER057c/UK114 family)
MTTQRPSPKKSLLDLGYTLPEAPSPVAAYVPAKRVGDLVYVSGQIPLSDGALLACGRVPGEVSEQTAFEAARQCALNALAVLAAQSSQGLDGVAEIIRLGVFVQCDPEFTGQPSVANGASELMESVFGAEGRHVRAAVGSISLPLNAPVEVELLARMHPE